jgi:hypothetical protein
MPMLSRLLGAGALTATVGSVLAAAAPASYASVDRPAGALSEAPTCVSRTVYEVPDGFDVFMTNNCGYTVYVRVIVNWAPDSVCAQLLPGQSRTWHYVGITGSYDHLATC